MAKILAAVVAIIIVGGGAWALFIRDDNKSSTNATPTTNTSNTNSTSSNTSSTATATDKVSIENMAYSPADITIKKGTMVTWTNNDSLTHTVTKDNADTGPDSSSLTPGAVYRFTYNQVGTFKYHCKFHSDMHGSVTVTE